LVETWKSNAVIAAACSLDQCTPAASVAEIAVDHLGLGQSHALAVLTGLLPRKTVSGKTWSRSLSDVGVD
jgi:hypothetical protein